METTIKISFIILLVIVSCLSISTAESDRIWSHTVNLELGVKLRWDVSDEEWLVMEMSAPVTGYVSVGFSPTGTMEDSDIVLGWVDSNGLPRILDLYATGNERPKLDDSQDYELISGEEKDGRTTITFRRKWDTCDEYNDVILGNDSNRVIWAISNADPEGDKPKYHAKQRGLHRTFVRNRVVHSPFLDDDPSIQIWDVHMDNNNVDSVDDISFCKIVKFPKQDKKTQLIGYRPLIQEGNEDRIHHILMYECLAGNLFGGSAGVFEADSAKEGGRCYTASMPLDWLEFCTGVSLIWTAGSEGNMFPINVGNPLGEEHGGVTYFMFEIHYDNPKLNTFVDSSGLRLYYTEDLREHDSSSLLVGTKISPFHVVPPKIPSFTTFGYCSSECTSQTIPPEGVFLTTVLLHSDTSGKRITLRHIRDGHELAPIAQENNYDYHYQQPRVVKPRKILPGDELITECEYRPRKTRLAFGGFGTRDEMCMSYINYYPKIQLTECKTQTEFQSFLDALGVKDVNGDILNEINMPYTPRDGQEVDYEDNSFHLSNSTYHNPLNALDALIISDSTSKYSTVGELIKTGIDWEIDGLEVERKWNEGKQYAFCTGISKKRFPLTNYKVNFPTYVAYDEQPNPQCTAKETSTAATPPESTTVTPVETTVAPSTASPTTAPPKPVPTISTIYGPPKDRFYENKGKYNYITYPTQTVMTIPVELYPPAPPQPGRQELYGPPPPQPHPPAKPQKTFELTAVHQKAPSKKQNVLYRPETSVSFSRGRYKFDIQRAPAIVHRSFSHLLFGLGW